MAKNQAPPDEPEVTEGPVVVTFGETEYAVPRDRDDWPLQAILDLADQNYIDGVKSLLGEEQWTTLYRDGKLTRREFREFANLLGTVTIKECVN